ncbi:hypothetical protein RCG19_08420 [Neobacillus sp. OS1-2]|uniref:hypothetical protein n=1 Tax=Neobacillus sp. OS1-2 TaxID=3070680 RepID=UPI0027E04D53|nr:hypothetical protein [Neobacillus sp. OS1-2]WML41659.1 hypothetical protein RCG19_08420 [Neobacillus sp. OS1-2]
MLKKWMFLSLISLSVLTASGCQNNNRSADEEAYDLRSDRTAPNYMSNRGDDQDIPENVSNRNRGKNEQHLVEDDITNQNPNFLDLKHTGSGSEASAGNHGTDINKAKQVIADTKEYVTDSVWINGDRMWVSVYKKGMLSDQGKVAAEARLHKKLIHALPRYNIEVRVKEDRR